MERVQINGAEIAYRIIGREAAPLMITLHGGRGFGDHSGSFKNYAPLADAGYRVLAFDMRGHGESSVTGPFTFQQLTDDIDALRKQFVGDSGKVIIQGGSFGGFLAQQYTIQYPQHVTHLILRGTAPSWHHEERALERLIQKLHKAPLASVEMLTNGVFDKFESDDHFRMVIFAIMPLYAETKYDANAGLEKNLRTKFRARVHNDLYSQAEKYFDYREGLRTVEVPSLVIVGDQDWICPPDESKLIASLLPNSKLVVIENANHAVDSEQNKQVLNHIEKFLKL